jgi:large subunit ribosomal protein L25
MKLSIVSRTASKKSDVSKLRREGLIPAILYNRGHAGEPIAIKTSEFSAFLRQVKPGHLPVSRFNLVDSHGHTREAVIKDIQYNITTYDVIHLDFEELKSDIKVNVKIPIECTGKDLCKGITLGGVLRQVIRHLRVSCLPKDIPALFELDISDLGPRQAKRLSDLVLPNTVRPLANMKEVAAVIVKR